MNAPESKKYDPRLDSLRAISALAIIPFHWGVLPFGWVGVQVFFVLSGMLITESLLKSKTRIDNLRGYVGYFFEKRMLRLFPLYYGLLLTLGVIYLAFGWSHAFWRQAPWLFTYTTNLQKMFYSGSNSLPATGHLWTLGVEWQFYLVWPFLVWKLREQSLFRFAILLVFLAPIQREITVLLAGSRVESAYLIGRICYSAPWSHWDALALGALLVHGPVRALLSRTYCWVVAILIVVAAGCLVLHFGKDSVPLGTLGYPVHLPYFHESIWGYSLINFLAACLIALTAEKSWPTGFANWKFLQYLGKISYGIYVYHLPLICLVAYLRGNAAWPKGVGLLMLGPVILADILLAHLSYQYFESWFLRKKATRLRARAPSPKENTLDPARV